MPGLHIKINNMAEKLFAEFPPVSTQQWEEVINKDLKGADYEKKLVWKTQEGFSVRPYYRAEDLKGLAHIGSEPGAFPFVRGTKCDNQWLIRQDYCACDLSEANASAKDGIMKGAESVGFIIDAGKHLTEGDIRILLDGIDVEKTEINFKGCCCKSTDVLKNFISYIKSKGASPDKVSASFDFDPLKTLTVAGKSCDDYGKLLKECVDMVSDYPGIRVIGVYAYAFNDAGSTISQELAYGLSMGSQYMDALTDLGLSADEIACRMKFTFSVGSNYFMEIAKFRAARLLWANIAKAYGIRDDNSGKIRIHAVTSSWNQAVYDPYVNMLRNTTEAMSAAIAGVDSLEVLPFDHAYKKPGEFSNRMSRNLQSILKEESHFDKVTDPAAGSYYIENLTASIIKSAWALFIEAENNGGYVESFKKGLVQGHVKESAAKRDKNIATRRESILGVNQFPNFNETAGEEVTKQVVSPEIRTAEGAVAEPLMKYRGAQAFEEMRLATDRSGKSPKVFMLTFGNLAMCRARAQFSSNFFAVAGIRVIDNNKFSTIEEGVKAAIASGAEIVVACSSDEEYAEAVPRIAELLGGKAILVVAGDPECRPGLEARGIKNFISVRSNVLETLKMYQAELGIK